MQNASSFINAGGSAHWDMLVFEHNEHQVEQVKQLATTMKFRWFRAKVSKRHKDIPIKGINPPTNWNSPNVLSGEISCHALNEQSIYVDAQGKFYPCCWIGAAGLEIKDFSIISNTWGTDNQHPICTSVCTANTSGTSFLNQWQQEISLC